MSVTAASTGRGGPPMAPSPLRLTPLFGFGSRRARFLVERNVYVYRHTWIVLLSGFFEPLFYLARSGSASGR